MEHVPERLLQEGSGIARLSRLSFHFGGLIAHDQLLFVGLLSGSW